MAYLPFIFFLLFAIRLCGGESAPVIAGDPFMFPFTCQGHDSGKLVRNLGKDGNQRVAVYELGEWKPVGKYRDRIRGNSSRIFFTRTFYTDSRGVYELSCENKPDVRFQLKVVFTHHVSVRPGEAALLPCFSENPDSSVLWEKNGTVVCNMSSGSDGCSRSADKRLSVSPDWSSSGDMSLTLEQVQPEDRGDYFCSGFPAAVRLKVTETQTRTTPSPDPPTEKPLDTWIIIIIIIITVIVTLLVSALCIILSGWFLHSHRTNISPRDPPPHEMDRFLSSHSDSQANGHG